MRRLLVTLLLVLAIPAFAQSADDLIKKVDNLEDAGRYQEAIPLARQALEMQQQTLAPNSPVLGESRVRLGALYLALDQNQEARGQFAAAVDLDRQALGANADATVEAESYLATAETALHQYDQARPLFEHVLSVAHGDNKPEALDNLAFLELAEGHAAAALQRLNDELALRRTPDTLSDVALVERELGDFAHAEEHYKAAGDQTDLAYLYMDVGRYADAQKILTQVLQASPIDSLEQVDALNNLAILADNLGDYGSAHDLLKRALTLEQKLHVSNALMVNTLADLGDIAMKAGSFGVAAKQFKQALAVAGRDDPYLLHSLATCLQAEGQLPAAQTLLEKALAISSTSAADQVYARVELANLLLARQQAAKAEALYRAALPHAGPRMAATIRLQLAAALLQQHRPDEARPLVESAVDAIGKSASLDAVDNLNHAACLMLDLHDAARAGELSHQASALQDRISADVLSFTSEQERLAWQQATDPWSVVATLGNPNDVAQAILRYKGIVLDSVLQDMRLAQQSQDPVQQNRIQQLTALRRELTESVMQGQEADRAALHARISELQRALAHEDGVKRSLQVTPAQVQAALPAGTVLIEIVQYQTYLGLERWQPWYGAIVLSHDRAPEWVPLAKGALVADLMRSYRTMVRQTVPNNTLEQTLRQLEKAVWEPLARHLPDGTRRVIVCPDGALNSLSFATLLLPDQHFLAERFRIAYMGTGRDLLNPSRTGDSGEMAIFADPQFKLQGSQPLTAAESRGSSGFVDDGALRGLSFAPLPGTAAEAKALAARATKWDWKPHVFLRGNVTKAHLQALHAPHILHLATHGFFLPNPAAEHDPLGITAATHGRLANPMLRSGLALAGAQTTVEALRRGYHLSSEQNGILTAEEVESLSLDGTWLVALSACDTGTGETRVGEGVLGLRRGFVVAGVQNLLMTLWPVADLTTASIMVDFYTRAHSTGSAPDALADVQRAWLVRLRQKEGLSRAVMHAGPFIMTFQGAAW